MENTKKYKKKVMVKMKTIIKLFYFLVFMELINLQNGIHETISLIKKKSHFNRTMCSKWVT